MLQSLGWLLKFMEKAFVCIGIVNGIVQTVFLKIGNLGLNGQVQVDDKLTANFLLLAADTVKTVQTDVVKGYGGGLKMYHCFGWSMESI